MKIYAVPTVPRKRGRPRFETEAEREAHREHIRRLDAMRLADKKATEGREKPFEIGSGFHQL